MIVFPSLFPFFLCFCFWLRLALEVRFTQDHSVAQSRLTQALSSRRSQLDTDHCASLGHGWKVSRSVGGMFSWTCLIKNNLDRSKNSLQGMPQYISSSMLSIANLKASPSTMTGNYILKRMSIDSQWITGLSQEHVASRFVVGAPIIFYPCFETKLVVPPVCQHDDVY